MDHKKIMFKQIGHCMDALERVFGQQFALCVKTAGNYLDVTVVVFIETGEGTKQVQVTTILDDPKKLPNHTTWVQRVIDALTAEIAKATTTPDELPPDAT